MAQELSSAMQDYLKVVCTEAEWSTEPITTTALATRLDVAPSSVSEMIRRLAALGLVHHRPYEAIQLTEEGRRMGLAMMRRHRLIETFLVDVLGYTWDEVHDEAEVLEHAISDKMLDRIDAQLGFPTRDPHGDPIPDATGAVQMPDAVRLDSLEENEIGIIARISDADPDLLRHLEERGLHLDVVVEVRGQAPFTGGTTIARLAAGAQLDADPRLDADTRAAGETQPGGDAPPEAESAQDSAGEVVLGEAALAAIWVVRAPRLGGVSPAPRSCAPPR